MHYSDTDTNELQMKMERFMVQKSEFIASREQTLAQLKIMKATIDQRHKDNQKMTTAANAVGIAGVMVGCVAPAVGVPAALAAGGYKMYSNHQNKSFEQDIIKEINEVLEREERISEKLHTSSKELVEHVTTVVSCVATTTASDSKSVVNVRQVHLLRHEVMKYSSTVPTTSTLTSQTMRSNVVLSVIADLYQLYEAARNDSELAKELEQIITALENHRDEEIPNLDQLEEEIKKTRHAALM